MNVLQNLVALYNRLEPDNTYRNVCKGMLTNMEEVANSTIYEIAELTNSSRTTVWRMIQKMGYHNFTDFHQDYKKAVKQYIYYNRIIPRESNLDDTAIQDILTKQALSAHKIVKQHIKTEDILAIAKRIDAADKVSLYVPYLSAGLLSFQQNLAIAGKESNYFSLLPDMLKDSSTLTPQSIVFIKIIDFTETIDMELLFRTIKSKGATICTVLAGNSRYAKYIDNILISHSENREVLAETLVFDIYFFMLSELYRNNFITK